MAEDSVRHRKRILRRSHIPNPMRDDSFHISNNNYQQQQQQRLVVGRKKNEGLICSICQGPAHGYNFDAITCESCKAFFRRNALKSNGIFKCRLNDGRCVITVSTRKRCKACRLAKCFEKGMRADWILTDEERSIKRQKIEENRRLRQTLYPDSPDTDEAQMFETKHEPYVVEVDDEDENVLTSLFTTPSPRSPLSSEDFLKIQQIQQAYTDSVRLTALSSDISTYPQAIRITKTLDMVNFATNMQATRVITYIKLLPEFSALNEHDKLILTKYNTFALAFIRSALNYDPFTDTYHEPNTDDCVFAGRDLIQCFSLYQYEQSTRCIRNLLIASCNDRFLLQVLIIIILFSKGSAICTVLDEIEPIAQDILSIYHAQNIFIELLWKYCEKKFGYVKTIDIWLKLTVASIDTHVQAYKTRRDYVKVDTIAD
jgi:hypothetical protein